MKLGRIGRSVLAAGLLVGLAACADAAPTPYPTAIVPTLAPAPTRNPAGDAANGQRLFVSWRCADCHGAQASGRIGPALAGTRQVFAAFETAIRQTRPPKPAFSEAELTAADVRDLYAWLRSLERTSAASPPALAEGEILGMKLYTESGCDACHGAFAQGSADAPVLANYPDSVEAFLLAMSATTGDIPGHDLETLDVTLMRRLYRWLQEGANPDSGC